MANRSTAKSIDEYIAEFPPGTQKVLEELRGLITESAPGATEKISYAIPTFHLNGNLVHFAGYEKHIGFYPGASGIPGSWRSRRSSRPTRARRARCNSLSASLCPGT